MISIIRKHICHHLISRHFSGNSNGSSWKLRDEQEDRLSPIDKVGNKTRAIEIALYPKILEKLNENTGL